MNLIHLNNANKIHGRNFIITCKLLDAKAVSVLSLDLSLREYRGSVSSVLFGIFKLDFLHGDLSF